MGRWLGGWLGGWVAGVVGNIAISAQLELELGLSLAKLDMASFIVLELLSKPNPNSTQLKATLLNLG